MSIFPIIRSVQHASWTSLLVGLFRQYDRYTGRCQELCCCNDEWVSHVQSSKYNQVSLISPHSWPTKRSLNCKFGI